MSGDQSKMPSQLEPSTLRHLAVAALLVAAALVVLAIFAAAFGLGSNTIRGSLIAAVATIGTVFAVGLFAMWRWPKA